VYIIIVHELALVLFIQITVAATVVELDGVTPAGPTLYDGPFDWTAISQDVCITLIIFAVLKHV